MSWRCACGAENLAKSKACEFCGRERAEARSSVTAKACAVCHEPATFWHELHQGEDTLRRCGRCHMEYLKSRTAHHDDRCTEPACNATVREHMEDCKESMERALLRMQQRLHHPPRTKVIEIPKEDYSIEWQQKKWAALSRLKEEGQA